MKKYLFIILCGMVIKMSVFAGGRFINVEYTHSRRILHNEISIELYSENNNDVTFYARLITKDILDNEHSRAQRIMSTERVINTERVISIEKDFFDAMYNRILDLNFKDIIKSNENRLSADGVDISLTTGTRQNNITISLRSPNSRITNEFRIIVNEIFDLVGMEEWLEW